MTRWQNLLDVTETEDMPEDAQDATAADALSPGESVSGDKVTSSKLNDRSARKDMEVGDPSIHMHSAGEFPRILPGDIVYIPQETDEQLSYKKGVYLGRNKDNRHTARVWKTMSEVEVSLHRLVRKTDCTAEEKEEAASLQVYQPYPEWEARPRYYRKNPYFLHENAIPCYSKLRCLPAAKRNHRL